MTEALKIEKSTTIDLLDTKAPALSTTTDMPIVETKPDASPAAEVPKEAVPPEKSGEAEQSEESATSATEESPGQPAEKAARGVGKKIQSLTKRAEEAERKAKEAEENLTRTLKAIEEGRMQQPRSDKTPAIDEDPEPAKPAKTDFSDPEAWDAAIIDYADQKAAWTARREVKAAREADLRQQTQEAQAKAIQARNEAYTSRKEKFVESHPDFKEVAEAEDVTISMPMAHAIISHEKGPEMQYYLGKHPEEAARIASLDIPSQLVELGVIAASLREPARSVAATPKPITSAPAPIKPVTTGTGSVDKSPEEMSMDEYAAYRKPQLNADRRPGGRR